LRDGAYKASTQSCPCLGILHWHLGPALAGPFYFRPNEGGFLVVSPWKCTMSFIKWLAAPKSEAHWTIFRRSMSSEHFGQSAWQFKRMSGSSRLKVHAAIGC